MDICTRSASTATGTSIRCHNRSHRASAPQAGCRTARVEPKIGNFTSVHNQNQRHNTFAHALELAAWKNDLANLAVAGRTKKESDHSNKHGTLPRFLPSMSASCTLSLLAVPTYLLDYAAVQNALPMDPHPRSKQLHWYACCRQPP